MVRNGVRMGMKSDRIVIRLDAGVRARRLESVSELGLDDGAHSRG
jgi:hypothetical protein